MQNKDDHLLSHYPGKADTNKNNSIRFSLQ